MSTATLASCGMIHHLTISVGGDVHLDGLVLAVIVLMVVVGKKL